jgi:murein DD-endopeptidase MepM/ murein hydrolase activator NlpD
MSKTEQMKGWFGRTRERLQNTYRLVVMNDETFEEVGSYRLTILNVYILLSTIIVVTAVLVTMAIAYTPLRRYVPGYAGNTQADQQIYELSQEVERMERELNSHQRYTENFRRMLVGDVETEADVPKSKNLVQDSTMEEIGRSEEDELLRQEVQMEEVGTIAKTGRMMNFSPRDIPLEQLVFVTPVNGEVSSGFNPNKKHYGIDVLAPKNTAIKAAMDGYVFFSDWTQETGLTIGIQHTNNVITFYKHNSTLLKRVGSFVRSGEAVAIIGNTGELTNGPHLHFELWHKGIPMDPAEYISF